jgi:hypothetical protein
LNNNGAAANGVLEGTIDLPGHFGAFPAQLYVAAAPYGSANGGALVSGSQVPAGNGDGDLQMEEFLLLNTRDLALDLPVSNAGPDQSVETGMQVFLSGTALVPSNLPASYIWAQLSGPAVTLNNASTLTASFTFGSNLAEATTFTFRLRVNDTRFDTDDTVDVQLFPMLDSDSDGLSDQEELTGQNNTLTTANPAGYITNPNLADSDGDGTSDGAEALAGTHPNNALSVFRITAVERLGADIRVTFFSIAGRPYQLQTASGTPPLMWSDVGAPVIGTESTTQITIPADAAHPFLRVRLGQD